MVANPYLSEAGIEIAGKEYLLVFDHHAQARLQELFGGKGWEQKLSEALDDWQVLKVDEVLAIGLHARQPGVWTAESLAAMNMPVIARIPTQKAIIKAISLSLWGPDGAPKDAKPPPQVGRWGTIFSRPFAQPSA